MLILKSLFHLLEFSLFYIINRKSVIPKIALIWQSLFACDFFTGDIFGFKKFYFFIIELKSRKIVHYHDNSGELKYFPYQEYEINGVATTPYSPNLNAYAERFIRSIRQGTLSDRNVWTGL
ncbi:MAG TPA: hypothetical protein DCO79_05430 [Spirochaeta sp.]|nr:hypothetical protein [Spirochaeta sp.]